MPYCPACKSEFRAGFVRCEECDAALVDELPAAQPRPSPPPNPAFLVVYRTTEMADALGINSLLQGHGLEPTLQNYHSGITAIGMPTSAAPFEVTVPATDAGKAAAIIKKAARVRPARESTTRKVWFWFALINIGAFALGFVLKLLRLI